MRREQDSLYYKNTLQNNNYDKIIENISQSNDEVAFLCGAELFHKCGYSFPEIEKLSNDEKSSIYKGLLLAIEKQKFQEQERFWSNVYTPICGHSEDPFLKMSFSDKFDFIVQSILKGYDLDKRYGSSFEYEISFGDISEKIEIIYAELTKLSKEDIVFVLNTFKSFIRFDNSYGDRNEFWARLVEKLKQDSNTQFMYYFSEILEKTDQNIYLNEGDNVSSQEYVVSTLNRIGFTGNLDMEKIPHIIDVFHSQAFLDTLEKDLGLEITHYPPEIQIFFLNFLWTRTKEEFQDFREIFQKVKDKEFFITTFLACSKRPEIGEKILQLAKYNHTEAIFHAYSDLVGLEEELENENINIRAFFKAILGRGEKLLLESLTKFENGEIGTEIEKKYSKDVVKSGALVKAMIQNSENREVLSISEFNNLSVDYSVETLRGNSDLLKNTDMLSMFDEENYTNPERFSKTDFEMIFKNLQSSYEFVDSGWCKYLQSHISDDITNENVKFFILRDKNTNELVSLCKVKYFPENPKKAYVGTHYVDEKFRSDFGFGAYVMDLALSDSSEVENIYASVAINNPSLERHINYGGAIGSGIVFERDEKNSSRELLEIQMKYNENYITKDKARFPDEKLKQMIGQESQNILVMKFDSRFGYEQDFISVCRKKYAEGYRITRLFYERDGIKPDLSETYMVFEKYLDEKYKNEEL